MTLFNLSISLSSNIIFSLPFSNLNRPLRSLLEFLLIIVGGIKSLMTQNGNFNLTLSTIVWTHLSMEKSQLMNKCDLNSNNSSYSNSRPHPLQDTILCLLDLFHYKYHMLTDPLNINCFYTLI